MTTRPPLTIPEAVANGLAEHVPDRRGHCRFCGTPLGQVVVDLGMSPLCESFVAEEDLHAMEPFYPLVVYLCESCGLVQLEEFVRREEIFGEYAYFSSYSSSWLAHVERFCDTMVGRFGLGGGSQVVEVASNDGYALQYFVDRGIPSLGVEPAANVARAAEERGVPTRVEFFGRALARRLVEEGRRADLLFGKNVLAQVHDLNDFVGGLAILLADRGVLTIEFPDVARLVEGNQFDTIYHEHFSYFSLATARLVFGAHGLRVFDVEEWPTHGGSLRVFACHADDPRPTEPAVEALLERERSDGVGTLEYYRAFDERVKEAKRQLLTFLIEARRAGATVAGYGAPGKGNTLLNYCGIRSDLLDYTVDRNPYKQGRYLPGTHIPVHPPSRIDETRPDYVLILPWNLKDEIVAQMVRVREWGGRFVVPIPGTEVVP